MPRTPRAIAGIAVGLAICLALEFLLLGGLARADVTTTAKRGAAGVKRGAHATAKAVAPAGSAVARGAQKGVTAVKHAGNSVGRRSP